MTAPYDYSALWIKAKLFLNRAMESDESRSFDERALWASLALELLAKAALSRTSPLLIASPSEEGTNLLIASGLVQGEARFTSLKAHSLYRRCRQAFRPFNQREALAITNARNEYLHGAGVGFTGIPEEAWWPKYWAQASILVNALDREIEELVGADRVTMVEKHLAQNKSNIQHRAEMLIARAEQRLSQQRSGDLPARIAEEWARSADLTLGLTHSSEEPCPVCGEVGVLEGEDVRGVESQSEQIAEDDFEVWMEFTVGSEHFSCKNCRLVLDGYELVVEAGLAAAFTDVGDYSDYDEPDYGND